MHPFTEWRILYTKDAQRAYCYARDIIKGPWPRGEALIGAHPYTAFDYAYHILNDRFPLGEEAILTNPMTRYNYALNIMKRRWIQAESRFIDEPSFWSIKYAIDVMKRRWRPIEPYILRQEYNVANSETLFRYIDECVGGRWPEAETDIILNDPVLSTRYAKQVIKGPWLRGEDTIAQDPLQSYIYARDILKGRFFKGERAISENAQVENHYVEDILVPIIHDGWKKYKVERVL